MRIRMTLRKWKILHILLLWLPLLFTSCGGSEHSYYPSVDRIEVSVGRGYIDVTSFSLEELSSEELSSKT